MDGLSKIYEDMYCFFSLLLFIIDSKVNGFLLIISFSSTYEINPSSFFLYG